eukprot:GHVP01019747.1.p1 GENE.GHVP01019747.1~~GHVP01019747.1.p1  ORF type:complete len:246 (+),score=62.64 GHVP01019747.1:3-740(+)
MSESTLPQERQRNIGRIAIIIQKITGEQKENALEIAKKFEENVFNRTSTRDEYVKSLKEKLTAMLQKSHEISGEKRKAEKEERIPYNEKEMEELRKSRKEDVLRRRETKETFEKLLADKPPKRRFLLGLEYIKSRKDIPKERFFTVLKKLCQEERGTLSLGDIPVALEDEEIFLKEEGKCVLIKKDIEFTLLFYGNKCLDVQISNFGNSRLLLLRLNDLLYNAEDDSIHTYIAKIRDLMASVSKT